MTCEFAEHDGAFVLGALAPSEHLAFEQHLSGCAECSRSVRMLAGLPGLLSRVDRSVLEDPELDEPVPPTLLPALLHAVRRNRRRRQVLVGAAAAAFVLAVVPGTLVVRDAVGGSTPAAAPAAPVPLGRSMAPVGDAPVHARLAFESVTWGTRLDLTCTYAPRTEPYRMPRSVKYGLFVRTRDGRTQQVGTWRAVGGRTMRLTAATAATQRSISSVEVRTADGRPVLELPS